MNKKKRRIFKKITLLLSLILIFAVTSQSTMAYYVTKTESVVNTFKPVQKLVYDLMLTKSVEHSFGEDYVIPENISFSFAVDLGEAYAGQNIATVRGGNTIDAQADENGVITINTRPGMPVYIQGLAEGTAVTVTELTDAANMPAGFAPKDGVSTKEVTIGSEGSVADFVNVYTPDSVFGDNILIQGEKLLEGREWQQGDTFTFALERQNAQGEWVVIDRQSISYDVNDDIFNVFGFADAIAREEFAQAGTYNFRIYEVAGNDANVTYDDTKHNFQVLVGDADMDGYLEIQEVSSAVVGVVTKNVEADEYSVNVTFTNTYTKPTTPPEEDPDNPDEDPEEVPDDEGDYVGPVAPPTGDNGTSTGVLMAIVCVVAVLLAAGARRKKRY